MRRALLALVLLGCHGSRTHAPVVDGGDAQAPAVLPRGTPFVVAVEHAVEDAFWLPDGHLLAVTGSDLLDIDPATNEVRHTPLGHPASSALGVRGGDRVVAIDAKADRVTVWDATSRKQIGAIEGAIDPTLSGDGKRLVVGVCDAGKKSCGHDVYDLAAMSRLATIRSARPDYPGDVKLSNDGRFALVNAIGKLTLADTTTGKTILTRKALVVSEGGASRELVSFHGDRVLLTSDRGIEEIALPSGKVTAQHADPFAGHEMAGKDANDDGTVVTIYDGPSEQLFTWDIARKKTTMTPKVKEFPGEPVTKRFGVERGPKCRLVEHATKRVVLEHPAVCSGGSLSRHAPGASPDDRLHATIFEGGAHVFDLATGKHVAGVGPLPAAKMEHLDVLKLEADVPLTGALDHPLWLTKGPPPRPAPRPAGFRVVAVTETHTFGVSEKKGGKRTVVAIDRTGKEVLHEELPPWGEELTASGDTAFVRNGTSDFQCQVGAGCKEVTFNAFIGSFDKPWVILGERSGSPPEMKDHLFNLATQEKRPLPCHAFGARVFREGPVVFCPGVQGKATTLTGPDGKTNELVLPASANHLTHLVGPSGPYLFFAGVVNTGLTPAYRVDTRGGAPVRYFLGTGHAIALLGDGKIERFGDAAANDDALRCLDGDRLLPWSACSTAFTVEGRL